MLRYHYFSLALLALSLSLSQSAKAELSEHLKEQIGLNDMESFHRTTPGPFVEKDVSYEDYNYKLFEDNADPNLEKKVKAVKKAIRMLIDKHIMPPDGLQIYLTNNYETQNRAFERDEHWNPVALITLGPNALEGGRLDALSSTKSHFFLSKATITTIHEIGHILHERNAGDSFWDGSFKSKAQNAGSVSGYASMNKKEFVAEVFAGVVIGMRFPRDVFTEYEALQGPTLPPKLIRIKHE